MTFRGAISRWLTAVFLGLLLVPGIAASCGSKSPVVFLTKIVASTGGMCGLNQYLCGGTVTERVAVKAAAAGSMCRGTGLFRAPTDFRDLLSCVSMPAMTGACAAPMIAFGTIAALLAVIVAVPTLGRAVPIRAGPAPFVTSRRARLPFLMPRGEPVA